ncbi:MAG: efflux RND transporter periplasmic adaptor subunit [Pseudolabrys sp.]|nr:efflux RND transporter periplasmic adaptor subunit [Pseudolabrys sp.]
MPLTFLLVLVLAGCDGQDQTAAQKAGGAPKPQVSVVTLHPQSVAITGELPGRTTASLTAEIRPQVNGIIKARLFKEGGEVKAGDPLYQIDSATYQAALSSALATLQKANAAVPSAEAKVERYQGLVKQNAVSKQDFDDANAALAQVKADVASAKASVDTARINLAYTLIEAPIGGQVDKSALTQGALVTANQDTVLTTIRTIDPINVDVTASSTDLLNWKQAIKDGRLKFNGPDVNVKLKLDNGSTYPLTGKLAFAESNVSQTTGTFGLRAEFANPDRLLLPGMYVRAVIEEGVAPNSYLVPQRAVTRNTKGEATAMFVTADGKVEQRVLPVGSNVGNNWLVSSGIHDGDRVIVEGTLLVRPGQAVNAVEATIDENTGEVRARKKSALPAGPTQIADDRSTPATAGN